LYLSSQDPTDLIAASIALGRARYADSLRLLLPPLIRSPEDVWSFHLPASEPNFITLGSVTGHVVGHDQRNLLSGAIVCIPNADPGFDWLFSHPIAGLITAYGGANSHMAIRSGELGLPAVIGAGAQNYDRWRAASWLTVDCANRHVRVLR
jgi:glutamine kinase